MFDVSGFVLFQQFFEVRLVDAFSSQPSPLKKMGFDLKKNIYKMVARARGFDQSRENDPE